MADSPSEVTALLRRWGEGNREAFERLVPLIYGQLRAMAHHRLRDERPGHTLNTTALVHEAYLKLVDIQAAGFRDRAHFLSMASRAMRRILVDYARTRNAAKRGGGAAAVTLDEALHVSDDFIDGLPDLDDALTRLETVEPRLVRILEHRFFAGLTVEETAEVLGVSASTVKRDLRFARAWLAKELGGEEAVAR